LEFVEDVLIDSQSSLTLQRDGNKGVAYSQFESAKIGRTYDLTTGRCF
jgi:hypothetical protein